MRKNIANSKKQLLYVQRVKAKESKMSRDSKPNEDHNPEEGSSSKPERANRYNFTESEDGLIRTEVLEQVGFRLEALTASQGTHVFQEAYIKHFAGKRATCGIVRHPLQVLKRCEELCEA